MRSVFLCGRNHHRIGDLELVSEGRCAVSISRGGARKTYSYTDPNEDAVAFALGPGGELAIAADGHHGELGSEAAIRRILETVAEPWTAERPPVGHREHWRDQGLGALMDANRAVLEIAATYELPPAPTTFTLALVRPDEDLFLYLSVGDSHVFAVDHGSAMDLGGRSPDWEFTAIPGIRRSATRIAREVRHRGPPKPRGIARDRPRDRRSF